MVTYTSAFLAVANLLALAQAAPAAPAEPVCFAVTTVITGSPIWVPRADPTAGAGWGQWPPQGGSSPIASTTKARTTSASTTARTTTKSNSAATTTSPARDYPKSTSIWETTTSATPYTTPTTTEAKTTTTTASTTAATTTAPAPAATCPSTAVDYFSSSPSGSCGCDFDVKCNRRSGYGASTKFWERKKDEVVNSLAECQAICNENSACTAAIWVNQAGTPGNEYLHCWQTSDLPQPEVDGYGQISFKGSCSGSCSSNYNSS